MRWAPWGCGLFVAACGSVAATPDAKPVVVDAPIGADAPPGIDAATCAPAPAGLAARWRGENNANDDQGLFNGTVNGNIAYTPGKHGSAFLLDGSTAYITADDGDTLWPTGSFSIEGWIKTGSAPAAAVAVWIKYGCGGTACDGNDW